jgi:hypothetical protein
LRRSGQQRFRQLAVQRVLVLLSIHAVHVGASKLGFIFREFLQHFFDVAPHVEVLLAGQFRNLAARHHLPALNCQFHNSSGIGTSRLMLGSG